MVPFHQPENFIEFNLGTTKVFSLSMTFSSSRASNKNSGHS